MEGDQVEFSPYITRLKADLHKYHSTMEEGTQADIKSPCGCSVECTMHHTQTAQIIHGMQTAIDFLANRIAKLEPKKDKRYHIRSDGRERYVPDYGVAPNGSDGE